MSFDKKEQLFLKKSVDFLNKKSFLKDVKSSMRRIITALKKYKPKKQVVKVSKFSMAQFTHDPRSVIQSLNDQYNVAPDDEHFDDHSNLSLSIRKIIWRAIRKQNLVCRDTTVLCNIVFWNWRGRERWSWTLRRTGSKSSGSRNGWGLHFSTNYKHFTLELCIHLSGSPY